MKNPSSQKLQMENNSVRGLHLTALSVLFALVLSVPTSVVYGQCDTILALSCETAPVIPLENYCGRTNPAFDYCCLEFCGPTTAIHNPTYHEFIAMDSSIRIEILVLPCETGFGLQGAIIATCPWVNTDILDCDPGAPPGDTMILTSGGIIPGESYWLLIDGSSGAMCNFLITHVEGAFQPETPIINLQVSGTTLNAIPEGNASYTYAWFECEANEVIGTDQTFEAPGPGCYCVTVRDSLYASTFCTTVITTSSVDAEGETGISIYPNPSSSVVDISVNDHELKNLTLTIFDYQGRVIKESRLEDGKYRHTWEDGHADGLYLFVIASDRKVVARQHIVYTGR